MSTPPLVTAALRQIAADEPLRLTVRGGCMRPLLEEGQPVMVAAARRYLPGDVVAFAADDGSLVVHRLIGYRRGRQGLWLQTRADASGTLDRPFPAARVIGRVVAPRIPPRRLRSLWRFVRLWATGHLPR